MVEGSCLFELIIFKFLHMKGICFDHFIGRAAMLTAPSTSHSTTDPFLFTRPFTPPFPHSPPSRSLTRAFRFSAHNGILQNPAKSADHWNAGALSTRTFSMGPTVRSSMKGKEREAFDPLDSGSFSESSLASPRVFAMARLAIGAYFLRVRM